mmetsp:Transcript_12611/g.19542  ORF Transcript_12611/g.19542 Transcript_12611/m.19542 type:complete len:649 (+) Transcript_12611:273-2219(+)|eukprot:CAMPEP_0195294302 /NCGR_PEP_ID=MMETSP0707-20130614/14612_1 /TAXON_ID=33640 /ORGANISM="Asterionellopsis glacialis, Strain CCMP134" /LENGTH=648 /DNA_ID=CAMNT_0040355233 /DNA_START=189 /DNA_END=2135 /DNA_ORIENTATION=-
MSSNSISGATTGPSQVVISVSCRKLPRKQTLRHPDSFVTIHRVPDDSSRDGIKTEVPSLPARYPEKSHQLVGKTEIVVDSNKPDFNTKFKVDYHFELEQTYVLRVFNEYSKEYLGGTAFALGQVLCSEGNCLARPMGPNKLTHGYVLIHAEEIPPTRLVLELKLSGNNLKQLDTSSSPNPSFILKRKRRSGGSHGEVWKTVWFSNIVEGTLNPTWDKGSISLDTLCDGDRTMPIRIQLIDNEGAQDFDNLSLGGSEDDDGDIILPKHTDLGYVETTVDELCNLNTKVLDIMRIPRKKKIMGNASRKPKKSGSITIHQAMINKEIDPTVGPSFLNYLAGGCHVNLMMAIDLTARNGHPSNTSSLHYISDVSLGGTVLNQYQNCIKAFGMILQGYTANTDTMPLWGYGAKIGEVPKSCFALSGPYGEGCTNVHEMMEAYAHTFKNKQIHLSGPNDLYPVINRGVVAGLKRSAAAGKNGGVDQSYSILVILTNDNIADVRKSIDICSTASIVPLSIIVVGVGQDTDFHANMKAFLHEIDNDIKVKGDTIQSSRNIVQFAALRDFDGNAFRLAEKVLKDIPRQIVEFFARKNLEPNLPTLQPVLKEAEIYGTWPEEGQVTVQDDVTVAAKNSNVRRLSSTNEIPPEEIGIRS